MTPAEIRDRDADVQFETAAAMAYAKYRHVLPLVGYDEFKLTFGAGALYQSERVCAGYAALAPDVFDEVKGG